MMIINDNDNITNITVVLRIITTTQWFGCAGFAFFDDGLQDDVFDSASSTATAATKTNCKYSTCNNNTVVHCNSSLQDRQIAHQKGLYVGDITVYEYEYIVHCTS